MKEARREMEKEPGKKNVKPGRARKGDKAREINYKCSPCEPHLFQGQVM